MKRLVKGCAIAIGIVFAILVLAIVVGLAVGGDDSTPPEDTNQPTREDSVPEATIIPDGPPAIPTANAEKAISQTVERSNPPSSPPSPSEPGLVEVGTHLVGRDIEPGEYAGDSSSGSLGFCYWARLSGTSGEFEEILANDNASGVFYVSVLPSDYALQTSCELRLVPEGEGAGSGLSSNGELAPGMYKVNVDIEPGEYTGDASSESLGFCYWARLSGTSGEFDELLANDSAMGVFYVTVLPTDYALQTTCELRLARDS